MSVSAATIEEVVVTAQKRAQSINDIGVSANAFSGEQIQELGVNSAVDLGAHTPGLVTVNSTSGGTPIFAIRGIGLDDFSANNTSGVGVYTDEIFASSPAYLGGQLFDIERVEVLKGPQGTLYGKNTTGGAINFITFKPTEDFEAYVEAGYGRYDTLELTGVVSGALTDALRGRLSANFVNSGEGWQKDIVSGKEFGEQDRFALRGQLAFDLGDNGEVNIRAYYSQDESTPESPHGEGADDFFGDASFAAVNSPTDPRRVAVGDLPVERDEDGNGLAVTVNYSFEAFDFVSITSWDQYDRSVVDNYDGTAAATTDLIQENELEQWSQEFRLIDSNADSFHWVAGINISSEEVVVTDIFDDSFFVTDSVAVDFVLDPADVLAQGDDQFVADYIQETDSFGLYLHTETDLTDLLKLTVGLRYSYDDRSFDGDATNVSFGFPIPVTAVNESHDEEAVTGKIGLDWMVNEDLMVFGSVSTSYKSGVYYGAAVLDSDAWGYIDPEGVLAYELGFKWSLLEGSMQLNGSVFQLEYEDRQSLVTFVGDDFSNFFGLETLDTTLITVPESETRGFELDLTWLPTESLTLQAGVAYLDTEVTELPGTTDLRGINPDPAVNSSATGDLDQDGFINNGEVAFVDALGESISKGAPLSQAPEWSYNGLIAYEFDLTDELYARLQTSYSWSDTQFAQLGDPNAEYGPIRSWDAIASIGNLEGDWKVSIWGRNLESKSSETYSFSGFAGRTVYRQQPVTYGITLRYAFN